MVHQQTYRGQLYVASVCVASLYPNIDWGLVGGAIASGSKQEQVDSKA